MAMAIQLQDAGGEPGSQVETLFARVDSVDKNVLVVSARTDGRDAAACAVRGGARSCTFLDCARGEVFTLAKGDPDRLLLQDAILFWSQYAGGSGGSRYDLVLLTSFFGHIKPADAAQLLGALHRTMSGHALVVVDDHDLNGSEGDFAPEDVRPFLRAQGYVNITESNYFIDAAQADDALEQVSYLQRWNRLQVAQFPLTGPYPAELDGGVDIAPFVLDYGVAPKLPGIDRKALSLASRVELRSAGFVRKCVQNKGDAVVFLAGPQIAIHAMGYAALDEGHVRVIVFAPEDSERNVIFKALSYNPALEASITVQPNVPGEYNSFGVYPGSEDASASVKTIDMFVRESGLSPDLLCMDVQGAEYGILQGAQETMRTHAPVLYLRYHDPYAAAVCTQHLAAAGYRTYPSQVGPSGRVEIKAMGMPGQARGDDRLIEVVVQQEAHIGGLLASLRTLSEDATSLQAKIEALEDESALQALWDGQATLLAENARLEEEYTQLLIDYLGVNGESGRLKEILSQVEAEREGLQQAVNQAQADLSWMTETIRVQGLDIQRLDWEKNQFQTELNGLVHSRSWKLTKPLRWLKKLLFGKQ